MDSAPAKIIRAPLRECQAKGEKRVVRLALDAPGDKIAVGIPPYSLLKLKPHLFPRM